MGTEASAQKIVELLSRLGPTEKFLTFVLGFMGTKDLAQKIIK